MRRVEYDEGEGVRRHRGWGCELRQSHRSLVYLGNDAPSWLGSLEKSADVCLRDQHRTQAAWTSWPVFTPSLRRFAGIGLAATLVGT
jgi:hypothetical protein